MSAKKGNKYAQKGRETLGKVISIRLPESLYDKMGGSPSKLIKTITLKYFGYEE